MSHSEDSYEAPHVAEHSLLSAAAKGEEEEEEEEVVALVGGGGGDDAADVGARESDVSGEPTPLPWKQLIVLLLLQSIESIGLNQVVPYVPFIVIHFLDPPSERATGFYAGLLFSSYAAASFMSSFVWGSISDRVGRRPTILLGLCGSMVALLLFGSAQSFYWALALRFLHGLLNANIGVCKSYLAESTDDSNRSQAMALIGVAAGTGRVVGAFLGGAFALPVEKGYFSPTSAAGRFFLQFPFLLPCLIVLSLYVVAVFAGFFLLPETLPPERRMPCCGRRIGMRGDAAQLVAAEQQQQQAKRSLCKTNFTRVETRNVAIGATMYALTALVFIAFDELFPLLMILRPGDGGFHWNSSQIGTTIAFAGAVLILYQLFLYPKIAQALGPLNTLRVGYFCAVIFMFWFPSLGLAWKWSAESQFILVAVLQAIRYPIAISCFISVFILISNSTRPSRLGAANGIGQSAAAFARMVGPILASSSFAALKTSDFGYPLNQYLPYYVLGLLLVVALAIALFIIPSSLNTSFRGDDDSVELEVVAAEEVRVDDVDDEDEDDDAVVLGVRKEERLGLLDNSVAESEKMAVR